MEDIVFGIARDVQDWESWVTLTDEAAQGTPIGFRHHYIDYSQIKPRVSPLEDAQRIPGIADLNRYKSRLSEHSRNYDTRHFLVVHY
ncbi:MAG TPA: hypothetical protein VFB89_01115 [Gemmatimonadales bacterium]|nr:hypothetical protein [Gemmatimonadales bacterium]